MSDAFSWIGQCVQWVAGFLPHAVHVKETQRAVMFHRSGSTVIDPGIHWYLPFWSEPQVWPIKRQTLNLSPQVLTTKDGKEVLASVVATYEIEDVHKALVETFDFQDTIAETSQCAVKQVIFTKTLSEIIDSQEKVDAELTRKIRSAIKPYGVRVFEATVKDFGRVRILRIVGNGAANVSDQ